MLFTHGSRLGARSNISHQVRRTRPANRHRAEDDAFGSNAASVPRAAVSVSATLTMLGLCGVSVRAAQNDPPPAPVPSAPQTPTTPTTPDPAPTQTPTVPVEQPEQEPQTAPEPPPVVPALPGALPAAPPSATPPATPTPAETGKSDTGKKDKNGKSKGKKDGKPWAPHHVGDDPNADDSQDNEPHRKKTVAEQLLGKWGKDLNISGNASLRSQQNAVRGATGAQDSFRDQFLSYQDYRQTGTNNALQNNVDLTVQGRILNAFNVNARLSNSRWGNQLNQVFAFNYKTNDKRAGAPKTSLDIGTVSAELGGNQLVTFSRSLQGVVFERDFGAGRVISKNVASLTKATTRRGTFRGNSSTGPYFMNASNLVEGSEKVRLNGRDLRSGEDYVIDYLTGQIRFQNGRIINPEDTVEFTYESQNYNTTPGILTGSRWNFNDGKGSAYGVTFIQQKATGQRVRNGNVTERFPVSVDSSYNYTLTSLIDPVERVEVKWLDRTLVEGIDYVLNRDLRYFRLLTATLPPDTSLTGIPSLSVTYRPLRQASLSGDRNVLGFDSQMRVAQNGTVNFQFGRSQGANTLQDGAGSIISTSWQSPTKADKNTWRASLAYRDIDDTFSNIDSVAGAFLQAERGVQTDFAYSPNKYYNFTSSLIRSRVSNRNYATATGVAAGTENRIWSANQSYNGTLNILLPKLPTFTLSHNQVTQNSGGTSRNQFTTTQADARWTRGILGLNANISRTSSQGRSVFASAYNNSVASNGAVTGSTIIDQLQDSSGIGSTTNSTSLATRLGGSLKPYTWLDLTANIGASRTANDAQSASALSGSKSTAHTSGFGAQFTPFGAYQKFMHTKRPPVWGMDTLALGLNLTQSSNGQSTSSFYNQNAGTATIIPTNVSGQKSHATALTATYNPTERVSLNWAATRTLSLVPGYDNTEDMQQTAGVTGSLNLSRLYHVFGWQSPKRGVQPVSPQSPNAPAQAVPPVAPGATPGTPATVAPGVPGDALVPPPPDEIEEADSAGIAGGEYPNIALSVSLTNQRVNYVGGQGNSGSRSLIVSASTDPIGRMVWSASFTRMHTDSALYTSATGTGTNPGTRAWAEQSTFGQTMFGRTRQTAITTGTTGLGTGTAYTGTPYSTLGTYQEGINTTVAMRAEYILTRKYSLTGELRLLDQKPGSGGDTYNTATGALAGYRAGTNYLRGEGTLRFSIGLNDYMSFDTDFNIIDLRDRDDSRYSYRARQFTSSLRAHF